MSWISYHEYSYVSSLNHGTGIVCDAKLLYCFRGLQDHFDNPWSMGAMQEKTDIM
jgi:hypothetical protein